jgi:hypothetical protein
MFVDAHSGGRNGGVKTARERLRGSHVSDGHHVYHSFGGADLMILLFLMLFSMT